MAWSAGIIAAWLSAALALAPSHVRAAQPAFPALSPKSIIKDCGDPQSSPDACRVRSAPSPEAARARLGDKTLAWWAEGDSFHVLARHPGQDVRLSGAVNLPMARLPRTDVWSLTLKIPRLDEAMIDMMVLPPVAGSTPKLEQWRGVRAKPEPALHRDLRGRLIRDEIKSAALGETRALTVYLPPNFNAGRRYPVAYFADGRAVNYYARLIEPLIASGKIEPLVVIGLHPGAGSEGRARDYLPGWKGSDEGFQKHERFLLTEVMPRAEALYGASLRREERLLVGQSNGAAWATATALRNPKTFGNAAGVSLGWDPVEGLEDPVRPRLFLAAGLLEDFIVQTRSFAARARRTPGEVVLVTAVAGHGPMLQEAYLEDILTWAFSKPSPAAAS